MQKLNDDTSSTFAILLPAVRPVKDLKAPLLQLVTSSLAYKTIKNKCTKFTQDFPTMTINSFVTL